MLSNFAYEYDYVITIAKFVEVSLQIKSWKLQKLN